MSGMVTIAVGLVVVGVVVMVVALVAMLVKRRSGGNDWAGPTAPVPPAATAQSQADPAGNQPVWNPGEPATNAAPQAGPSAVEPAAGDPATDEQRRRIDDSLRFREQSRPDEPTQQSPGETR